MDVALDEIEDACKVVCEVVDLLSFGDHRDYYYYDPGLVDPLTDQDGGDINEIMRAWARTSSILNLPESDPELWSRFRKSLPSATLARLTEVRRQLGMSDM